MGVSSTALVAGTPSSTYSHKLVSVVIPTRARGPLVARTVQSILASPEDFAEVIVVDQSPQKDTFEAASPYLIDPRFQYIHSSTVGISAARNIGVAASTGAIVVHTDDDCEVPLGWVSDVVKIFDRHPDADMVVGSVLSGPCPPTGFIPSYKVKKPLLINGIVNKHRVEGIGACFGYRRILWSELGGFDELLGVGGHFPSGEEADLMIRALEAGNKVLETPELAVIHHGFRTWDEAGVLIQAHLFGIGGMSAKQIRRGCWAYLYTLSRLALRWAVAGPSVDFGHHPPRLPRLLAFLRGFAEGWGRPCGSDGRFIANPQFSPNDGEPHHGAESPNQASS